MILDFDPGDKVINPLNKEWGIGQVQSIINEKVTIKKEANPVRYKDLNSSNLKFILEKGFLFITMPCFDRILFSSLNFFKSKFFFDKPENKSFFILPQLPSPQEHNDIRDFEHLF